MLHEWQLYRKWILQNSNMKSWGRDLFFNSLSIFQNVRTLTVPKEKLLSMEWDQKLVKIDIYAIILYKKLQWNWLMSLRRRIFADRALEIGTISNCSPWKNNCTAGIVPATPPRPSISIIVRSGTVSELLTVLCKERLNFLLRWMLAEKKRSRT